jgi:hypothetical protein
MNYIDRKEKQANTVMSSFNGIKFVDIESSK